MICEIGLLSGIVLQVASLARIEWSNNPTSPTGLSASTSIWIAILIHACLAFLTAFIASVYMYRGKKSSLKLMLGLYLTSIVFLILSSFWGNGVKELDDPGDRIAFSVLALALTATVMTVALKRDLKLPENSVGPVRVALLNLVASFFILSTVMRNRVIPGQSSATVWWPLQFASALVCFFATCVGFMDPKTRSMVNKIIPVLFLGLGGSGLAYGWRPFLAGINSEHSKRVIADFIVLCVGLIAGATGMIISFIRSFDKITNDDEVYTESDENTSLISEAKKTRKK